MDFGHCFVSEPHFWPLLAPAAEECFGALLSNLKLLQIALGVRYLLSLRFHHCIRECKGYFALKGIEFLQPVFVYRSCISMLTVYC